MKKVNMSEEAILRRLKTVDELRTLCLSLMKAKRESDEKRKRKSSAVRVNQILKKTAVYNFLFLGFPKVPS